MGDFLLLAVANVFHRRTRSLLTVIGVFIGVAAIVALVSLGQGLQEAIVAQFEQLGKDKITVLATAGFASSPFASEVSANPLTVDDVKAVEKTRGVASAAGVLLKPALVEFSGESKTLITIGYPLDERRKLFEDLGGYEIREGRKLRGIDGRKAVLGSYAASNQFTRKIRAGDSINLQGKKYGVVGVFEPTGDRFNDGAVYIPLETARSDFDKPELVSMIFAQTQPGAVPSAVADEVRERLRKRRGEKEGEETFTASTSEQLLQSFTTIFAIVQAVVLGLAAISLVVGGIGIMNTMYTSVLERTREIGVMKAVGARNSDVLALFLFESGLLGLLGGLLGVATGFLLGKAVEAFAQQSLGTDFFRAFFPTELVAGALVFSFLVGAFSGVLPALRAARLKPVDALRYE